tara:strand:- start:5641 stop:6531 length:891 start_codon:yes stop_codon:yes gene_type:complete
LKTHKFSFVGIAGKPNVGKSTLINALVGEKIAIVSDKSQTTRGRILGIKNSDKYQFVFVDTPGLHKGKKTLNRTIVKSAENALTEVDVILLVVDRIASSKDKFIYQKLASLDIPMILVVNKIDLLQSKKDIDKIILSFLEFLDFKYVIPISAKKKSNFDYLIESIYLISNEGEKMFPEDYISNQTEISKISEWIREKVLLETKEEIPHSVAVIIDNISENSKYNSLDVNASIIVERASQKKILIGKNGQKLKSIGTKARLDLNKTLKKKIYLELWVKVKKNWSQNQKDISNFGYGG